MDLVSHSKILHDDFFLLPGNINAICCSKISGTHPFKTTIDPEKAERKTTFQKAVFFKFDATKKVLISTGFSTLTKTFAPNVELSFDVLTFFLHRFLE